MKKTDIVLEATMARSILTKLAHNPEPKAVKAAAALQKAIDEAGAAMKEKRESLIKALE